ALEVDHVKLMLDVGGPRQRLVSDPHARGLTLESAKQPGQRIVLAWHARGTGHELDTGRGTATATAGEEQYDERETDEASHHGVESHQNPAQARTGHGLWAHRATGAHPQGSRDARPLVPRRLLAREGQDRRIPVGVREGVRRRW